jgi:MFS transporter, DHA3 family, macrolide efflux protein
MKHISCLFLVCFGRVYVNNMAYNKLTLLIVIKFLSLLATHTSNFGLNVYLYQQYGSLFYYSIFLLFIVTPQLLLSPILGIYADRYNKRTLILIGHMGAGIISMLILAMLTLNYSNIFIFFVLVACISVCISVVFVAFDTLLGANVSQHNMHYLSSAMQFIYGLVLTLAPVISSIFLEHYSVLHIFYIDIIIFLVVIIILCSIKLPDIVITNTVSMQIPKKMLNAIKRPIIYLKRNPVLLLDLVVIWGKSACAAALSILLVPLTLSITNISFMAIMIGISSSGVIIGSLVMLYFRTTRYAFWINRLSIVQSVIIFACIFEVNTISLTLIAFIYLSFSAMISILSYENWQKNVPRAVRGGLLGIRTTVISIGLITGYMLHAPYWDAVTYLMQYFSSLYDFMGQGDIPEVRLMMMITAVVFIILIAILDFYRVKWQSSVTQ